MGELRFSAERNTIRSEATKVHVRENQSTIRATRGMQLPLIAPPHLSRPVSSLETKGVVYTKRWVVELLLDLAGYRSENNLVDAVAVEPAAGDGAFLVPMIERLVESCKSLGRPLVGTEGSLIAYELDVDSAERARTLATGVLAGLWRRNTLGRTFGRQAGCVPEITCLKPQPLRQIS